MPKGLEYRAIGQQRLIIPTPLYVDEVLLAEIIFGVANRSCWREVRPTFQREGMPAARASVCNLYYLPAVIKFLDRREGITRMEEDYPEDGPDSFHP